MAVDLAAVDTILHRYFLVLDLEVGLALDLILVEALGVVLAAAEGSTAGAQVEAGRVHCPSLKKSIFNSINIVGLIYVNRI